MKPILSVFFLLVCGAFLSGCGGGDSQFSGSPFQGSYQGTFTSSNSSDQGSLTVAIDRNGNISGTLVNNGVSPSSTQNMSGNIQDNGDASGTLSSSTSDYPYAGNLGYDTAGDLSGPIDIQVSNTSVVHATFVLTYVNRSKKVGSRAVPVIKQSTAPALMKR